MRPARGQPAPVPPGPAFIGDLARATRRILRRCLLPAVVVLAGECVFLVGTHQAGGLAFGFIAAGSCLVLYVWSRFGLGLPVVPMLALQHLIVYGLPIVTHNATLTEYPSRDLYQAGREVLAFSVSLAASWVLGTRLFAPSRGASHALAGFWRDRGRKLIRAGFALTLLVTANLVLESLDLNGFIYDALPNGSASLIAALFSAAGMIGFFLLAMSAGRGGMTMGARLIFWTLLAFNCALSASSLLLSAPLVLVAATAFGLFWGTGRVPWRFLVIVMLAVAFLNAGKYAMRARYWVSGEDGDYASTSFSLDQLPSVYAEWTSMSMAATFGTGPTRNGEVPAVENESILRRINNLQNLLYVIRVVETEHVTLIHGATYALVPPLLIPRILWSGKPRSHVAQEILNVHFGRQDQISTYSTYVAWGLLPEAYGNFGPIAGALSLGCVLGGIFAWVEAYTANKLISSLEGLLAFALMVAMANSYEMVSTVLVTSTVDSLLPIGLALLPFVHRTTPRQALLQR